GKIAAEGGHSAWVTSPMARAWVHRLRGQCDAVIVGGQTVRRDNPHLTSHGQSDRNPLRVVMSRQLNLPEQANLWASDSAPTIVFCGTNHDSARRQHLEESGVEVTVLANLEPLSVLEHLHTKGLRSVLWECGGTLAASAIAQHCVQKVCAFIAPKIVGGPNAPTPVGDLGIIRMNQAHPMTIAAVEQIGPDILIQGYLPSR
ncbi:MAG: bifunctional diaminohydroxyphosphoribosylaminopyrimidine deaminase/5-amino-6-(5-phosphoribosylamino)uracil reductase RibD, partial [Cyanobacteria bacterium P01_H01_bin.58]